MQVLQPFFRSSGMSYTLVILMTLHWTLTGFSLSLLNADTRKLYTLCKCGPAGWHNHIPWSAGNNLCWMMQFKFPVAPVKMHCRRVLCFLDEFDSLSITLWILALGKQQASKAQLGRRLGAWVPHRRSPLHQHGLLFPTDFDLLSRTYGSSYDFEWNLFVLPAYCSLTYCEDFIWFFHLWIFGLVVLFCFFFPNERIAAGLLPQVSRVHYLASCYPPCVVFCLQSSYFLSAPQGLSSCPCSVAACVLLLSCSSSLMQQNKPTSSDLLDLMLHLHWCRWNTRKRALGCCGRPYPVACQHDQQLSYRNPNPKMSSHPRDLPSSLPVSCVSNCQVLVCNQFFSVCWVTVVPKRQLSD